MSQKLPPPTRTSQAPAEVVAAAGMSWANATKSRMPAAMGKAKGTKGPISSGMAAPRSKATPTMMTARRAIRLLAPAASVTEAARIPSGSRCRSKPTMTSQPSEDPAAKDAERATPSKKVQTAKQPSAEQAAP